ncbi:MAG: ribose-phosphate pyrophosphokinase [Candidatus Harrisonbacteria bacterium]|nr:ribose-phosphate pyrophosphokinase [Candidatus Harrisonbacteria bacterium]
MNPSHENLFVLVSSPLMYDLGEAIIRHLEGRKMQMAHHRIEYTSFANGEFLPYIPQPIRGQHAFFLHGLQHPDPNSAVMKMLLTADAMRRASVAGITLVTPYLPYLRQDRKDRARVPISARLLADLIESNRTVKQLITIDMHAEQEQGFFSIPVDNLTGVRLFSEHIRAKFGDDVKNLVAVAADFGAAVRTRRLARALGDIPAAIFEKRRPTPNQAEIVSVNGTSVAGKEVVIYEDMIDTGHTILGVIKTLKNMGARGVHVYATHGIFSGGAEKHFAAEDSAVVCTDSIPRTVEYYQREKWLTRIPIDAYFAEAIYAATQMGGSISRLAQ